MVHASMFSVLLTLSLFPTSCVAPITVNTLITKVKCPREACMPATDLVDLFAKMLGHQVRDIGFLETFAGKHQLSSAYEEAGYTSYMYDISFRNHENDITSFLGLFLLTAAVMRLKKNAVSLFGIPCSSWVCGYLVPAMAGR